MKNPLQIAAALREEIRPQRTMWRGEIRVLVDELLPKVSADDDYMPTGNAFSEGGGCTS